MKYKNVWGAVDKLAKINGLSTSGLAKKAGLDPTTFNKSKRLRPDGNKRWPSLESINKITEACGVTFEQFCQIGNGGEDVEINNSIPYIKFSKLKKAQKINAKGIDTRGWDKIRFPDSGDVLYAIDIDTKEFEPVYRKSSILVAVKNSEIRRGDRIVTLVNGGEIIVGEFVKRSAASIEMIDICDPKKEIKTAIKDIKIINRIVWASQ
ncbi:MAG: hypothetical protein LBL47_01040 [Lactobacillus sp.]|jgi:phage repressor protein C with HTH and peptisase S24 domain|nr:hypothetical protein [Lactobacillus sp.]